MTIKILRKIGFSALLLPLVLIAHAASADYKAGIEAVAKLDYKKAFSEFSRDAKKGHSASQYSLALLFHHGRGRAVNLRLARSWYEKAAKQDHTSAQNNLATLYRDGLGTKQNYVKAAFWFRKASKKHALAMNSLALLYR